jgi:hypothetical protein
LAEGVLFALSKFIHLTMFWPLQLDALFSGHNDHVKPRGFYFFSQFCDVAEVVIIQKAVEPSLAINRIWK